MATFDNGNIRGKETSFKFKGYSKPNLRTLFDGYDDDYDDENADETGESLENNSASGTMDGSSRNSRSESSSSRDDFYDILNPAELKLNDFDGGIPSEGEGSESGEVPDLDELLEQQEQTAGCLDRVPEVALSSCVWAGSNLLSRMLFQIYSESGDESIAKTRLLHNSSSYWYLWFSNTCHFFFY